MEIEGERTNGAAAKEENFENSSKETQPFMLLGMDISHLTRDQQYTACTVGLFSSSLLYGYLQELITVQIFNRNLALFLSTLQFSGYTLLVYLLRTYVYDKQLNKKLDGANGVSEQKKTEDVPHQYYWSVAFLRALELGLTNIAMQYVNFPAKTLMKSSRVVFTMLFGIIIQRKSYKAGDYFTVLAMVVGLAIFLHADSHSAAVFHYMGVIMLIISLICDGVIVNISETIMHTYGVGQDEFIFRVYSIALIAVTVVGALKGDLDEGFLWMSEPGTYGEFSDNVPMEERTWSVGAKIGIMILFSTSGFFALSCCSAITKNFGALTMSVTSTTRKATTLFLSFFLFNNVFTGGHALGILVFMLALILKIMLRREAEHDSRKQMKRKLSGLNLNRKEKRSPANGNTNGKDKDSLTLRHGTLAAPL